MVHQDQENCFLRRQLIENGAQERPEMLAPWQLPPGRGFQTAAEIGYAGNGGGGACLECRKPIYRLW